MPNNSPKLIHIGELSYNYSSRGNILSYSVSVEHKGLKDYKVITAKDKIFLQQKIDNQIEKWEEKYCKVLEKQAKENEKLKLLEEKENVFRYATEKTEEAQNKLDELNNILAHTLDINDAVDWNELKDKRKFTKEDYVQIPGVVYDTRGRPNDVQEHDIPKAPDKNKFQPKLRLIDKIIKPWKQKKIKESDDNFAKALNEWGKNKIKIEADNALLIKKSEEQLNQWYSEEEAFIKQQAEYNKAVDDLKGRYLQHDPHAILENSELVLNASEYPDYFPKTFELAYTPETKMLLVEYSLLPFDNMPTLKEVKVSKSETEEIHIKEAESRKKYDSVIHQVALRTIHELFEADIVEAIEAVVFNGMVNSLNKATGKWENKCIVSIMAKKKEFLDINLKLVEPKACFKKLKGVSAASLSEMSSIQPIMQMDKNDKRFIDSYDVANSLTGATNLATMDWEDFEHLVREIFEKEFSTNGGEVKVTQASRDGGVDAIAFDPDPIRGGKIVIQAKRYSSTVGVSAVRDLYGTVLNEGATKGILVTTSDFGPDSYDFSKDKPLTLLNGSNLLFLLEKYGHKAKIDLAEAKKILSKQDQL